MSRQQKEYDYHYLTLTGEGDAHQLVKDYYLSHASAWNKGEVEEGRYQFQQMCIRMYEAHPEEGLYWHEAIERFLDWRTQRQLLLVPHAFERTLHIVSHGVGYQSYGFYLSPRNIEGLARIQAHVHYHGYQQRDDGHDYPGALVLPAEDFEMPDTERAYLSIESTGHTLEQLAELTGLSFNVKRSRNQGDIMFAQQPVVDGQLPRRLPTTLFMIDSGVTVGQPLARHIDAVMAQLAAIRERVVPLLLDYRVRFCLSGTGTFQMPYELVLTKAHIEQLAQFRCAVDMDLYARS